MAIVETGQFKRAVGFSSLMVVVVAVVVVVPLLPLVTSTSEISDFFLAVGMDFVGNACFHHSSVQIYVHVISVIMERESDYMQRTMS